MTIQEIEQQIIILAAQHKAEEDDELSYLYEMEANQLILGYLIENNISLGEYDIAGLYNKDEAYEFDRADILSDIQFDVLSDPAPFEVHPEALHLYAFLKNTFWPDTDEDI